MSKSQRCEGHLKSSTLPSVPDSLPARWWLAIRPHSLGTALAPVIVGGGLAIRNGGARPLALILACLGVAFLLVGVNLGNDYFDYRQGADPPIGESNRALQREVLPPRWFLIGGFVAFGLGGACGVLVVIDSPPSVLLLGLPGALLGFFYTAPPFRLGYRGLGEIVVFLTLGEGAVLGSYVVTAARWSWFPLIVGIPISLTVTAILHANNLRDLDEDRRSGKRTLAVRLGTDAAIWEFRILIVAALAAIAALAVLVTPLALAGLALGSLGVAGSPGGERSPSRRARAHAPHVGSASEVGGVSRGSAGDRGIDLTFLPLPV